MAQDITWKSYFLDDERYADIINGIGCGGKQLITKEDLQELDTQTGFLHKPRFISKIRRWKDGRKIKIRDMLRKAAFGVNFAIIGIENQETIDYAMPLRNMAYDVGDYENMLDFTDIPEGLRKRMPDYSINLVEIRKLNDTSIFKTDVRQVIDFIRCSEDKKKLKELVDRNDYYKNMEEDAFDVAAHYTNAVELIESKNYYEGKDGKVDMCRAIKELIADGRSEGRSEGITIGRTEGISIGRNRGIDEKTRTIVHNMLNRNMPIQDICAIAECSEELVREVSRGSFKKI